MTEIIDDTYIRTPGYGTPFGSALTCLRCGAMVDGVEYATAPTPRQQHAAWHETLNELLAGVRQRETVAAEAVEGG